MNRIHLIIALLVLGLAIPAAAEEAPDAAGARRQHYVISVKGKEVTIDAGRRDGVTPGAVLDVFRSVEPVVHPVTGEVMGEAPIVVGAIKIARASEKYAIARVVKWEPKARIRMLDRIWIPANMRPVSPMDMPEAAPSGTAEGQPAPGRDPEEAAFPAEKKAASGARKASRIRLLIPGLYQWSQGRAIQSTFLFVGAFGLAGGGAYYKWKSRGAHRDYMDLPVEASQDAFDAAYERYREQGQRGDAFLIAAGGVYLLNLIDGAFGGRRKASRSLYLSGEIDGTADRTDLRLNVAF